MPVSNNPFRVENVTKGVTVEDFGFDLVYLSVQEADRMTLIVETDDNFDFGDEIEFYQNSTGYFRGSVEKINTDEQNNWEIVVTGADGGIRKERVQNTFNGIAFEQAVKQAVENNTSFTVQVNVSTGQTLDDKEYDDPLGTLFQDLIDATRVQIRVDTFNETIYLEKEGAVDNSRVLNATGSNVNFRVEDYEEDGSNVIDTLKITGQSQDKEKTESFSPSSGQETITLSESSDSIELIREVRVDGNKQRKGLKDGGGDYISVPDNDGLPSDEIEFQSAFDGTESVDVDYTFVKEPTAVVTVTDADGEGFAKKKIPSVTSDQEAQNSANRIIEDLKKTELSISGNFLSDQDRKLDLDIRAGEEVTLNDRTKNISDRKITIKKATHSFPGGTTLQLGRLENYSLQKEKDRERRQGNEENNTFESIADGLKEKGLRESSKFTRDNGWVISNTNQNAKQSFVFYVPNKDYVRYAEIDLVRSPLTFDETDVSVSGEASINAETDQIADRYDNFGGDTHSHTVSGLTPPASAGDAENTNPVNKGGTLNSGETFTENLDIPLVDGEGGFAIIYLKVQARSTNSDFRGINVKIENTTTNDVLYDDGSIFQTYYPATSKMFMVAQTPSGTDLEGDTIKYTIKSGDDNTTIDYDYGIMCIGDHSHVISTVTERAKDNDTGGDNDYNTNDGNEGDLSELDADGGTTNLSDQVDSGATDTKSGTEPGTQTVKVDVTNSAGTTNTTTVDLDQGEDSFGNDIPVSFLSKGFNKVEVYPDSNSTIKLGTMIRLSLTDRE